MSVKSGLWQNKFRSWIVQELINMEKMEQNTKARCNILKMAIASILGWKMTQRRIKNFIDETKHIFSHY
jgi:hypothetical protein